MMWYLLLLIGVAACAASKERGETRLRYLVTNQELHLEKLLEELHELEEEFSELSEDVDDLTIKHLKARVHNLEEEHHHECLEHEASCGGDIPECVSDLFFCDGHKDCKNGNDEDEEHCSEAPAHVGSSYTGIASWGRCEDFEPHHAVVTITASERKDFFKAVIFVRATLSFEEDEKTHEIKSFPLRGFYKFGPRILLLGPDKGTKPIYGVQCHFHLDDDDNAECHIMTPSSLEECAHFQATRY